MFGLISLRSIYAAHHNFVFFILHYSFTPSVFQSLLFTLYTVCIFSFFNQLPFNYLTTLFIRG